MDDITFSPDPEILVSTGNGKIQLWDVCTGKHTRRPFVTLSAGRSDEALSVAFSPNGRLLASGNSDGTIKLWNPVTGQAVGTHMHVGSGLSIDMVAFSPDSKLLASADSDGTVLLWNPATGRRIGVPIPADPGSQDGINDIAFSPDGHLMATAADGTARIWHVTQFADPHSVLCADVGPPGIGAWSKYAPGEFRPDICP